VALALQILDGKPPAEKTVLVDPVLWDNVSDEGKALIAAGQNPDLSPEWPVSVSIPGWTTYTMDQIIACKGPNE
jgi:ribose transport system substrate-binding protein